MARILIVDDEPAIRQTMAGALRRQGYDSIEAESASVARDLARKHPPDLIISDICMEGGDGFSLLKEIRADERTRTIPFIIITGHPNWDGMLEGIENAADGYIPKPVSLSTLLKTVKHRLEREKMLRRNAEEIKQQLQQVLQASPDLIGLIEPDSWRFFFLNRTGMRLLETGENFQVPVQDFFTAAAGGQLKSHALPALDKTGLWTSESVLISRGRRRIPVKLILQSHRGQDQEIDYLSLIAHNLTDQQEHERALRQSEHRFRCLVDALPDGVLMYDAAGAINFSNARTAELLGYSAGELLGMNFSQLFGSNPPDEKKMQGHTAYLKAGDARNEFQVQSKSGKWIPVSVFTEVLQTEGEETHLCILHDLTRRKTVELERQKIEMQLRQAQKLESIGQLAAGIAHEINTPTQYIGDNTRFLKDSFAGLLELLPLYRRAAGHCGDLAAAAGLMNEIRAAEQRVDLDYVVQEVPAALEQSLEGIERVTKIVRAMKDFSHPNTSEKTMVDINQAIESTVTVARNEWKYVAELQTQLDRQLPLVPCLPGEFNQVILNIIVNAAHAIGEKLGERTENKGVIAIRTRRVEDTVEICIRDTGNGIPAEIQSRVFEPFFTTKEVGKGTGQGLAIARSVIVEKHGGTIHFESEPGKGTTFSIRLPLQGSAGEERKGKA